MTPSCGSVSDSWFLSDTVRIPFESMELILCLCRKRRLKIHRQTLHWWLGARELSRCDVLFCSMMFCEFFNESLVQSMCDGLRHEIVWLSDVDWPDWLTDFTAFLLHVCMTLCLRTGVQWLMHITATNAGCSSRVVSTSNCSVRGPRFDS